MTTQSELDY